MIVRVVPRWLSLPLATAMLAALVVFASTSAAVAAVPPLEMASERQASLRKGASGKKFDVAVTVTAGKLKSHTRTGVALGSGASLEFGDDAPVAWKVLSVLLIANDPITKLQTHIGRIDASKTSIETLDDGFVYVWGSSPEVAMRRDLSRIRRLTFRSETHRWEFRLSGELGVAGLPERVHILRSGKPYASVELEKSAPAKQE